MAKVRRVSLFGVHVAGIDPQHMVSAVYEYLIMLVRFMLCIVDVLPIVLLVA